MAVMNKANHPPLPGGRTWIEERAAGEELLGLIESRGSRGKLLENSEHKHTCMLTHIHT